MGGPISVNYKCCKCGARGEMSTILIYFISNPVLLAGLCLLVAITLFGLLVAELWDLKGGP